MLCIVIEILLVAVFNIDSNILFAGYIVSE